MAEHQPHPESLPALPMVDEGVLASMRHDFLKDPAFPARSLHDLNEADHALADEANIVAYERSAGNMELKEAFLDGVKFIYGALKRNIETSELEAQLLISDEEPANGEQNMQIDDLVKQSMIALKQTEDAVEQSAILEELLGMMSDTPQLRSQFANALVQSMHRENPVIEEPVEQKARRRRLRKTIAHSAAMLMIFGHLKSSKKSNDDFLY